MKTFDDLEFKNFVISNKGAAGKAKRAYMHFSNDYGISVIDWTGSNISFECCELYKGKPSHDGVKYGLLKKEVTEMMKNIQQYEK